MSRRRSRGARAVRSALYGLAVAHLVDAVLLRRRRLQLRPLPGPDSGEGPSVDAEVVAATGVEVDGATLAAIRKEMETSGAEVVDLVPADLPAERLLRVLRRIDGGRLERDPLYSPGGAHVAVARRATVAERMAQRPDGAGGPLEQPPTPRQMVRFTRLAQRYAPGRTVMRVAPGLRSEPRPARDRWDELEELMVASRLGLNLPPLLVGAETVHLLAMTAGLLVAPAAAASALATWSMKPALVVAGGSPEPAAASWSRLVTAWRDNLRMAGVAIGATRQAAATRRSTPISPAPPVEQLFERRRETCPWCGSESISGLLDAPDFAWHKPGSFHLDECTECRHVFQNPALSVQGMEYYYEGVYDGAGEEAANVGFGLVTAAYRQRMDAVARQTEPRAWLDVGTGHGHFCLAARQRWPEVHFDGLDMGESVREAERRGWIDTAYHGLFPELADGLPRSYDVVSMHHYLEHTTEPRRELQAAAKVLEPGGHLEIEVPDPDCPWARRLGRYWFAWFQPEHLHFVTCENLVSALEDCGFEVVSVQRGSATMGADLGSAVLCVTSTLAPSPLLPSQPPRSAGYALWRAGVLTAAAPLTIAGLVADLAKDVWTKRGREARVGNTYRVVARRR